MVLRCDCRARLVVIDAGAIRRLERIRRRCGVCGERFVVIRELAHHQHATFREEAGTTQRGA